MPINSNVDTTKSRRDKYKKEITLLSAGYYAPAQLPGGKITVFPWDNEIDELLMQKQRTTLLDNVLWELIPKLCNLNGLDVNEMLIGDANTVLLVSRALLKDCVVEFSTVCPGCKNPDNSQIKVPDELGRVGEKTPDYGTYDDITLPDSKDLVGLRPLTIGDAIQIRDPKRENRDVVSDEQMYLLAPIVHIGHGRPDQINEVLAWHRALSPRDVTYLGTQSSLLFPHLDTEIQLQCEKCGRQYKHDLNLDVQFFR